MKSSALSLFAVSLATAAAAWRAQRLGDSRRDIAAMATTAALCLALGAALFWAA